MKTAMIFWNKRKNKFSEPDILNNVAKEIVNIHRFNTDNVGDLAAAPYLYFKELGQNRLDIVAYKEGESFESWTSKLHNSKIVVGGGGFLERKGFKKSIDYFLHLANYNIKIVFWGVGHNYPQYKKFNGILNKGSEFQKLDCFSTRDEDSFHWVPCVSCMSDLFDKDYKIQRDIGIIKHYSTEFKAVKHPIIYNSHKFDDVIRFIGESEYILTDSYHAMYWSILLKRKVLVVPNSSKMFSFRFSTPVTSFDAYKKDLNKAIIHNEALDICRESNKRFAEKVYDYLEIT